MGIQAAVFQAQQWQALALTGQTVELRPNPREGATALYIIAGVLILGLMENAMNLLNISPFAQYVVRGLILLAAVLFDRYKQVRKARV